MAKVSLAESLMRIRRAQLKTLQRIVAQVERDYKHLPESSIFVPSMVKIRDLATSAAASVDAIVSEARKIKSRGNRTPAVMEKNIPHFAYLDTQSKLAHHIDFMVNEVLNAIIATRKRAKGIVDEKERTELLALDWELTSSQQRVHAVQRQAEALSALNEAVLRAVGVRVWQGHKRYLRWEGDSRGQIPTA